MSRASCRATKVNHHCVNRWKHTRSNQIWKSNKLRKTRLPQCHLKMSIINGLTHLVHRRICSCNSRVSIVQWLARSWLRRRVRQLMLWIGLLDRSVIRIWHQIWRLIHCRCHRRRHRLRNWQLKTCRRSNSESKSMSKSMLNSNLSSKTSRKSCLN